MSDTLTQYRELEELLIKTRWIHQGLDSTEEDEILDQMDDVWDRLTDDDRAVLNAEPARSLLRTTPPTTRITLDEDVWSFPDLPPRRKEAA